jgi:hypothetical protein
MHNLQLTISPQHKGQAYIYLATTLLAVSLNIVLQKIPGSKDQGFFISFNQF